MRKEEIAQYAYAEVPFYQDMGRGESTEWERYPVIDKSMVLQKKDSLFSPEYISDLFTNQLERVLTSGSTGDCLEIFWKKEQNIKSLAALWHKRKKYYGILPNDKRCYFFTTKIVNGLELEVEKSQFGLGFCKINLNELRLKEIYHQMEEYKPRWMIIQPSLLIVIMQVIKKFNLKAIESLEYIEITGERLATDIKREVEKFFGCRIASQYGCYEANSIAYECPCGKLHVMSENVYVEVVGEDEICITSLHNKVMPFIRYKIGDRGRIKNIHKCTCGSKEPILELKMARENDLILNADGTVTHSDIFCGIVERINLMMEQVILQYQIVQTDFDKFDIYLSIEGEEDRIEIETLFCQLAYERYHIGGSLNFHYVDYLYPSEKTGKLAWFITKMKGEKDL